MIEAKFGLFQAQQEGVLGHALKLLKPRFGKAPKRLDAVAVRGAEDESGLAVADAKMAVEADGHQLVIAAPTVRVDQGGDVNSTANSSLKSLFRTFGRDFRAHLSAALEEAEDAGFATHPVAALATYAPRIEVAFVTFNGLVEPDQPRASGLQPAAQMQVQIVDRPSTQPGEAGRVRSRQIQRKQTQYTAKFGLRNFCAVITAVGWLHNRKLHYLFTKFAS